VTFKLCCVVQKSQVEEMQLFAIM